MALGETAVLAVELKLNGVTAYTSGITQAEAATSRFGATAGTKVPAGLSLASRATAGFGGALSHAKSAIGGLLTGPVGIIGLTGGLLGLTSVIKDSMDRATSFGETVDRLVSITGQSVDTVSALASAFLYFGVSGETTIRVLGMAEKNLGLLTSTMAKAEDFAKTYGLSLVDASGHVKDMNTLILDAADFFNNKLVPASTKAAALSKIFGRNWQDLVEVFEKGRPAIAAAEQQARDLGLTLSGSNLDDLLKFRDASRELNTAMGGLQLQIGLALIPSFTDLAHSVSSFVAQNRTGIVAFFKDAAKFAGEAGRFIGGTLIPAIRDIAGVASTAWNAIPGGLRDLLIKGFIANKTVKFLFGVDLAGDIGKGIASQMSKAFGGAIVSAGLGKAFIQPVFVTNQVPGVPGGIPGEAVAGAGIGAIAAPLAVIAGATLAIVGLTKVIIDATGSDAKSVAGKEATAVARGIPNARPTLGRPNVAADVYAAIAAARQDARSGGAAEDIRDLKAAVAAQTAQEDATHARLAANSAALAHNSASVLAAARDQEKGWANFPKIIAGIEKRSAEKYGGKGLGRDAVMATYNRDILRHAERIMKSTSATDVKLARLQALQADIAKNGDPKTRAKLAQEIELLKTRLAAATAKVGSDVKTAVKDQKPPIVNVKTVTNVSYRSNAHAGATSSSYTSVYTGRTGGSRPA